MINKQKEISIIIVSYNTLDMTKECLKSVFDNVKNLKLQIIVVDNASSDGSIEMLIGMKPKIELILNNDNKGFAAANNQGFSIVKYENVLLLNSDTIILGEVLEKSLDYMSKNNDVGAMGCRVLNTDMSMQSTCSGYPTLFRLFNMTLGIDRLSPVFDKYLLRSWLRNTEKEVEVISGCYLLTRKSIIDKLGGLDEDYFFFGEETDWCLRLRKNGWKLRFAPVGKIIHHGGGSIKKLNHKRDVMLTEAIIKLHKKNNGVIYAMGTFIVLTIFNISRAIIWSIMSIFKRNSIQRAKHFWLVTISTFSTWTR